MASKGPLRFSAFRTGRIHELDISCPSTPVCVLVWNHGVVDLPDLLFVQRPLPSLCNSIRDLLRHLRNEKATRSLSSGFPDPARNFGSCNVTDLGSGQSLEPSALGKLVGRVSRTSNSHDTRSVATTAH